MVIVFDSGKVNIRITHVGFLFSLIVSFNGTDTACLALLKSQYCIWHLLFLLFVMIKATTQQYIE